MPFLALIGRVPLKAWLTLGAVAALAFVLWHDHHMSRLLRAQRERSTQLEATLITERKNAAQIQADLKLSRESSHVLQDRLHDIESRGNQPPPRVLCRATRLPGAATESGAAAGAPGAAEPGGDEGPLRDVGPAVAAARREAEVNAARCLTLIEWEQRREH